VARGTTHDSYLPRALANIAATYCALQLGGMVGSVLVGRLAALLHDRQSLACCLFTLVCIAGLWSLALHLPQDRASVAAHYMPGAVAYSQHYYSPHGGRDTHPESASQCLRPDKLFRHSDELHADSMPLEHHPFEQCQCKSVLLHTIALVFPMAGSSTLALNQLAVALGSQLLSLVKRVMHVNRYFGMRCALFLIGFGINGPKTLVSFEMLGVVPARFCGTVTGVAGLFAQVGAYFAGWFIALTVLQEGWCSYVALLVVSAWAVAALLLLSALI
jgi:sugar phosphate permease